MVNLPDDMLGKSSAAFKQIIENLEPGRGLHELKWKGLRTELAIRTIPISALRYNLRNVRVKPWLGQYVSEEKLAQDYWDSVDEESISIQKIVHGFLVKNPDRKNVLKYFKRGEIQKLSEPLICTPGGKVINGNQRLSVYRELYTADKGKYSHLEHAYVAILPNEGSFSDERKLESSFQLEGLQGVYFDWIQQGLQDFDDRNDGETYEEIAQRTNRVAALVKRSVRLIKLAGEFLSFCDRKDHWQHLRTEMKVDQAIDTLDAHLNGKYVKTDQQRKKLKKFSFSVMRDPDATKGKGTSVHLVISKTAEYLDTMQDIPRETVDSSEESGDSAEGEDIDPLLEDIQSGGEGTEPEEMTDIENANAGDIVDSVLIKDELAKEERRAKNQDYYAERQIKALNSSLDKIIANWDLQNTKGLKPLVRNAIEKLERILDKL